MRWSSLQWPRSRKARIISAERVANDRAMELQTAKEILAEIFRARPEDIEDDFRDAWRKEELA